MTMEANELKVGDPVTWTRTTKRGMSMNFHTCEGTITSISGDTAFLKLRNGRKTFEPLEKLRRKGERTELTEMLIGAAHV